MSRFRLLLPLVLCVAGCSSHLPLPLIPVAIAAAPVVATARFVDSNLLVGFSNPGFKAQGRLIDEQGNPIDGVEVRINTWTATHRNDGRADSWRQSNETRKLDSAFDLKFRDCNIVDLRFSKPGHFNQRVVFTCGYAPEFIKLLETTDGSDCVEHPEGYTEELDGGGTIYHSSSGGIKKTGLKIILAGKTSLPPVMHYNSTLTFNPPGGDTIIDLARLPRQINVDLEHGAKPPASSFRLTAEQNADGSIRVNKPLPYERSVIHATHLRLTTTDPSGGFIPIALGRVGENRLPFFRTPPAEGYKRELNLRQYVGSRSGRRYLVEQGEVWFYFKINGKYGLAAIAPGESDGTRATTPLSLYVQPDGARNLGAASANQPTLTFP